MEEEKKGDMDQKARHFKYFEMLDTLPVQEGAEAADAEHALELNAEGASANVIAWNDWWVLKEESNQ